MDVAVPARGGVRVAVDAPRVTVVGANVGETPNASVGVGVAVGSSRVGIGACVGVASKVPGGTKMSVGGGCVGEAPQLNGVIGVGVGARCTRLGRINRLNVPAQYITTEVMRAIARQPYPS